MSTRSLRSKLGIALLLLAVALYVVPALAPVQPHLTHDTRRSVVENASQIDAENHRVVAYENLSERGKELYRTTLRNDGEYSVPVDSGAPDFEYPTENDLQEIDDPRERQRLRTIIIERPPNADLPPPDEPVDEIEERRERRESEPREEERAEERPEDHFPNATIVGRYDMMETRTEDPPLGATATLGRLAATLLAVLSTGVGGYLLSSR